MHENYYEDGAYYDAELRQKAADYLKRVFEGTLSEMKVPAFGYMALAVICDSPYVFDGGWGAMESQTLGGDDE